LRCTAPCPAAAAVAATVAAAQRFFWMPAGDDKAGVTIEGRADFPKSVIIKGKFVSATSLGSAAVLCCCLALSSQHGWTQH
jgi:hypothetical protein